MKIVSFVSALLLTAVSYAQPTVKVEEITRTIIDKGLEIVDPGLYQGSCMFHALADYALASGDSLIMEKADSVAGRFAQGEIAMKGTCNFHSYRCGGSAVAALALAGKDGYAEIVRDHASWQWKNQRRTQSDGLMTGQYTRPAQPDIFFADALFAVVPFFLYAGLMEGNEEYVDYAAWMTLEARKILKDDATGLWHQSRGTTYVPLKLTEDCWSRGNGWASMAVSSLIRYLPKKNRYYKDVRALAKEFYTSVLNHQDPKTGLWFQEMTDPSSYVEISGSGLLLEGLGTAIETGVLSKKHMADFLRGIQGLLMYVDPDGSIGHTCRGCLSPGNGTKEDYKDRQFYYNEAHAFGPAVFAMAQALRLGYDEIELPSALGSANDADRPATYVRFIEERKEDFAWENDLAAFRVYSRFAGDGTASGVDFWGKCVDYPIINDWYAHSKHGRSYHKYYGQGADYYNMGKGRGVGGTGVWEDGKLYCSKNYACYKIVRNDKEKIEFILYYQPFKAGDRIIQETKRIEMICGTNFYKVTATYDAQDGKPVTVAAGVTTFGEPKTIHDAGRGLLWVDEHIKNELGKPMSDARTFSAVVAEPSRLAGVVEHGNDRLLLFSAASGEKVVFFAGAGWMYHQNNRDRAESCRRNTSWSQLEGIYIKKN